MSSLSIQQALREAKEKLVAISDAPHLEAEVLLSYALNVSRSYLHTWPNRQLSCERYQRFVEYVDRRCHREPIAYITGQREFWSLNLTVTADTLIPRPETELLVEQVLAILGQGNANTKVADLGTGSGAIALALAVERPHWQICATDVSNNALAIAKQNANILSLANISFYQGHWCHALPDCLFDVIVSNPPYLTLDEWPSYQHELAFEPCHALIGGQDGLAAIRQIVGPAKNYLKSGGHVIVEHGFSQGAAVRNIFTQEGYAEIFSLRDLSSQERVTVGKV